MRSSLVSKILADLESLKNDDAAKYLDFFRAFGRVLKEGLHSDYEHSDKLKELVMFPSDKTEEGKMTTLRAYKDAMPEGQKEIYYLVAESYENAKNSPQLEAFRKRGLDVLFLCDAVDEWIVDTLYDYDGTKLKAIDKGEIELGTDEEKKAEKKELEDAGKEYKALLDYIKDKLKDDVKDVRLSPRLTDSACCLVAEEGAMSPAMLRMMKAMGQEVPKQQRILELNPKHPVLTRLADELKSPTRDDEAFLAKIGALYDLALVGEGAQPRNPLNFVKFFSGLI
jgi:molecular chaperone HtpG